MGFVQTYEAGIPYSQNTSDYAYRGLALVGSNTHIIENSQSYHNGVVHVVLDANADVVSVDYLPDIDKSIGTNPSVCYGNGVLWMGAASTYNATAYISLDAGATWTYAAMPTHYEKCPTIFANGNFTYLATQDWTGTSWDFVISADGVNWTVHSGVLSTAGFSFTNIAYGNGIYVALTWDNTYFTSPNGITWTERTMPSGAYPAFITYSSGAGKFATVELNNVVCSSTDGINWTKTTVALSGTVAMTGIVATDVGFAASQHVNYSSQYRTYTSTDGITWAERFFPSTNYTVACVWWTGTKLVALNVGNGVSYTSSNYGVTWSATKEVPYFSFSTFHKPIAIGADLVAIQGSFPGPFATVVPSTGEVSLMEWDSSAVGMWGSRVYSQGNFIVMYNPSYAYGATISSVKTSTDGITWTTRSLPSGKVYASAVSDDDIVVLYAYNTNFCCVSTDGGITWTERTFPGNVGRVFCANGAIYAGGSGTTTAIYVSSNGGASWSTTTAPASLNGWCWRGGAFKNLVIATCSNQATYAYSTNGGATWASGTFPEATLANYLWPEACTFAGQMYAQSDNKAYSSSDGLTWTLESSTFPNMSYGWFYSSGDQLLRFSTSNGTRVFGYEVPVATWFTSFVGCSEVV